MSAFLPIRPYEHAGDPEPISLQDPRRDREEQTRRWEIRAAQWRALDLARAIWGEAVSASLSGYASRADFRGLLHLDVPVPLDGEGIDLDGHREREDRFTRAAGSDPVLRQVPLIYIFDLSPAVDVSSSGPGRHPVAPSPHDFRRTAR